MSIKPENDVLSAREKTLRDLTVAVNDLSGNLATDSTLQEGLTELQDTLLMLNANINDGVPMTAADLSALEQVTATIIGLPSDYPDTATHTKLDEIKTLLAALPTTYPTPPTPQTDALTNDQLRAAPVTVNGTVTVSNPTTPGLTDTQLRATPVPVTVTNPTAAGLTDTQLRATPVSTTDTRTDYPSTAANTKLDTLHADNGSATTSPPTSGAGIIGWLRGIYDKIAALPTTIGLTDAQLRAGPVPVSGTVTVSNPTSVGLTDTQLRASAVPVTDTRTDYPSTAANTKLDTLHTDLTAGIVTDSAKATPLVITGNLSGTTGTAFTTGDVSAYRSLRLVVSSASVSTSANTFEGSFDGVTWFGVSAWVQASPSYANAGGPYATFAIVQPIGSSGPNFYDINVWFTFFRLRLTNTVAVPGIDIRILALNTPAAPPYAIDNDGRTSSPGLDTFARGYAYSAANTWQRIRAGQRGHNASSPMTGALQVVANQGVYANNSTVVTTGSSQNLGQTVTHHALQVRFTTGTVTAANVVLQGSLDGAGWFTLVSWDTAGGQAFGDIVFAPNKPVNYIRINLVSMAGTGNVLMLWNGGI